MTDRWIPAALWEALDADFTQARWARRSLNVRTHDQGWVQSAAIRRDRARAMAAAIRWVDDKCAVETDDSLTIRRIADALEQEARE